MTLLVTDLEGFTGLVERIGDRRALGLLRSHNRILRKSANGHRGTEVAHTGDGIIAAFFSPVDAARGAVLMQRQLRAFNRKHPCAQLRVRIGLHAGTPLSTEGRLFGHCVNLAVRICAYAQPETVMLSEAVARKLPRHQYVPHGWVALRGIAARERLYALDWNGSIARCAAPSRT